MSALPSQPAAPTAASADTLYPSSFALCSRYTSSDASSSSVVVAAAALAAVGSAYATARSFYDSSGSSSRGRSSSCEGSSPKIPGRSLVPFIPNFDGSYLD